MLIVAAVVILALADSSGHSSGPPGPLSLNAPPHYRTETANCTKVLEQLPIGLDKLTPRIVHTTPATPFVVAWGDPAVILRCGVDRPASLHSGSSAEYIPGGSVADGPYFAVTKDKGGHLWTSVDRAVYVSVSIPSKYQGSDIMAPLGKAIRTALPAVCAAGETAGVPTSKLCAERR